MRSSCGRARRWMTARARKIRQLRGARHAPADWIERARIVALSWDGLAVPAIAARIGCMRTRCAAGCTGSTRPASTGSVTGPAPGASGGSPRRSGRRSSRWPGRCRPGGWTATGAGELSADDERGPAQWTLDTLAETARDAGIAVGRSQVRRILLAEKVRWRRTRSWTTSTDRSSPQKDRGRGALHRPAGRLHGDLRRRTRPGDPAHLRARTGLVARPGTGIKAPLELLPRPGEDLGPTAGCASLTGRRLTLLRPVPQQRLLPGLPPAGRAGPTPRARSG